MAERRQRTLTALAAATTAVLAVTVACGPPPGPAGRVTDKDRSLYTLGKSTHFKYYLTVRTPAGRVVRFRASSTDYRDCYRGSAYPGCTNRKDR